MNKKSLLVLSLAAFNLNAGSLDIGSESVQVPRRLAGASVSFDDGSFYVTQGAQKAKVESFNLDKDLRGITGTNLTTFLEHGYLKLNQNSEGEYTLTGNGRVLGGGNFFKTLGRGLADIVAGVGETIGSIKPMPAGLPPVLDTDKAENALKRAGTGVVSVGAVAAGAYLGAQVGATTGAAASGGNPAATVLGAITGAGTGAQGGSELADEFNRNTSVVRHEQKHMSK